MPDQANPPIAFLEKPQTPEGDRSLTGVFFEGLPAMAGIVTMIAQPFAQESLHNTLGLPAWLPFVVAISVSGLLAAYKMFVVRHSGARECAICIPLLMLIIFSAYATGNNVVYYAKEGYTKAGIAAPAAEDVTALKQERNILQEQLKSANGLIDTLRQALNVPDSTPGKPRSVLPTFLGGLRPWTTDEAFAQEPRRSPLETRPSERVNVQQLREKLREYEVQQQQLNKKMEQVKREEKSVEAPQQRLIKSW